MNSRGKVPPRQDNPTPVAFPFRLRMATSADAEDMIRLLPRLAAFPIPDRRQPEDLFQGDSKTVRHWSKGDLPSCFAVVAEGEAGDAASELYGFSFVRVGSELLSETPSAHLEILVVAKDAEGKGVGSALLAEAESEARRRGALTMTLHVFRANERALGLYQAKGFDPELLRMIKDL